MKKIHINETVSKELLKSDAIEMREMVHHWLYRVLADEMERNNMLQVEETETANEQIIFRTIGYVMSEKEYEIIMKLIERIMTIPKPPSADYAYYAYVCGLILADVYKLKAILNGEVDAEFLDIENKNPSHFMVESDDKIYKDGKLTKKK